MPGRPAVALQFTAPFLPSPPQGAPAETDNTGLLLLISLSKEGICFVVVLEGCIRGHMILMLSFCRTRGSPRVEGGPGLGVGHTWA